ncbi:MAG: AAA family ATPase [Limimaricola sp.]|uniref:ATP-binding protein n=1 Tax=Limimaricola sp. TaxID=2211665 RepID=UPI001DBF3785|nr:adenylate/guanylate cyclase domain-containing protein [Limimaricola sp.]MBI1416214.1 AAA family ATPase [Limimaricola sp.]
MLYVDTNLRGEKRWVAALMVDLVGSTELAERLGPEATFLLMQDLMRDAVETINSFGGYYVEYAGDSVFAIFGAPVAIENATLNACRAALALQAGLAAKQADLEARYGATPRLRVGISSGEVMVAALSMGDSNRLNALGSAVNIASRIQSLAPPGEVYCSAQVKQEIEGYGEVESVGAHDLKGIAEAQEIYRLVALHDQRSSLDARIARGSGGCVGRAEQIDRIEAWLLAPAADAPVLTVIGPPGIGKSRLVRETLDRLPQGLRVSVAYCGPSDVQSSLRPLIALLRDAARLDGAQESAQIAGWLGGLLGAGQTPSQQLVDLIGRFQRATPDHDAPDLTSAIDIRRQIRDALRNLAADPARRLVIEDAHWLDSLSRDLLQEVMADPASGARLLISSREPVDIASPGGPGTLLQLTPLTEDDIAALIASTFPGVAAPDALKRQIFEKSEGNPLFAEELMRHVLPDPARGGEMTLPSGLRIGSIQHLVFSRFDALGDAEKVALKQAAFVGRLIKDGYIRLIVSDADEATRVLELASQHGLVEPVAGTRHWRFSHVLVQEAIIDSVPDSEARRLHARAAEILLDVEADAGTERAADIARHYDRAGLRGKAVTFYVKGAEAAWQVYALDVCIAHLERIDQLLEQAEADIDDTTLANFLITYARVLDVVGNWTRLSDVVDRHLPRLKAMASRTPLIICLTLRAKAANQCSRDNESLQMIDEAIEIARETGDDRNLAIVKIVKMDILNDVLGGTLDEVAGLFKETRSYVEAGMDPHLDQLRIYEMAAYYRQQGDLHGANAMAAELQHYAETHNDSRAHAFAGWVKSSICAMVEDHEGAMVHATEGMKHSLPGTMDYTTSLVFLLGARLMTGDETIENASLEQLSDERRARGDMTMAVIAAFYSSALYFKRGKVRAGLDMLARTETMVRAGAERGLYQQFYIKKAELMLTIAGLLPSPFDPPKMALAEMPAAVKLRLRARTIAEETYRHLTDTLIIPEGFQRARIEMGMGLIARARRDRPQAQSLFASALRQFEAQEVPHFAAMTQGFMR